MGRLVLFVGLLMGLFLGFVSSVVSAPLDTGLLERKCTYCHDLDVIIEKQAYIAEWQKIVERMTRYDGSEVSSVDKLKVLKFINDNLALDGPAAKARREQK